MNAYCVPLGSPSIRYVVTVLPIAIMFGVENCQILSNLRKYIEIYCITVIQILVSDTSHYENVPFEVPAGWVWVKLSDICIVARGGSPRPIKEYLTDNPDGVNWIKIGDTDKDGKYINSTKEKIRPEGVSKSRMVHKGDFLLTNSMSFGRPYILNVDGCIHDGWLAISPLSGAYDTEFLYYLLSSNFAFEQFAQTASGGVVSNLNSDKVSTCIFPLPPLAEQRRIVEKINVWLKVIEEIANDSIEIQSQVQQLKTLILDSAITGKLVRQNLDDEPAIELLKKVNPEYKPCDNRHYGNVPYKVPETWQWVKLKDLCVFLSRGKSPVYSETDKRYPVFAQKCNLKEGGISLKEARFLEPRTISKWKDVYKLQDGDILVNSTGTGTVCRTRLFRSEYLCDYPFVVPDSHVSVIRTDRLISSEYAYLVLVSKFSQTYMMDNLAGSTNQKELYISVLENLLFPLPPADEQKRIVKCVNEIYMQLEQISSEL